ncbi:MAG TPA: c-type cytochrome [Bryobacteraceae bacterium]|jgi:cytochrome c|nr:c-type cytochrome [Bryobacteraceae bacterium]
MNRLCAGLAAAFVVLVVTARTETDSSGKDLFERRCSGCHSLNHDKEGPRLGGVYGRAAGSVASFNYSDALKNSHITWDADSLDKWLSGPEKLVPATDMAFHVESASERTAIISYLKGAP